MSLARIWRAVIQDERDPPQGEITAEVSQAVQGHEVAVARFNKAACGFLDGDDCHCYELPGEASP